MNEETLVLYYYNDGLDPDERSAVEQALLRDAELAERYQQMCAQLDGMAAPADSAAPASVRDRWHDAIEQASSLEAPLSPGAGRSWFHATSLLVGGALAASLLIGIGVFMPNASGPGSRVPSVPVMQADHTAGNAFSRGMVVHFKDSRAQLATLSPQGNGARSELIRELVAQNRLFERAAEHSGAPDVARVLRAFEPLLLRMADKELPLEEKAALQAQLQFEMNIMLTKLDRELSDNTETFETVDI